MHRVIILNVYLLIFMYFGLKICTTRNHCRGLKSPQGILTVERRVPTHERKNVETPLNPRLVFTCASIDRGMGLKGVFRWFGVLYLVFFFSSIASLTNFTNSSSKLFDFSARATIISNGDS